MTSGLRGRGERVANGVWRLRLPLPWAGIPHVNAWALERPDGIVLVDCGLDAPGSLDELERALGALDAGLSDVRLLVCTHAHPDHYGQAARVVERADCELWMHPRHAHTTAALRDPAGTARLRRAAAQRAGVPDDRLPTTSEQTLESSGVAGVVEPNHELHDGVEAVGWRVIETPGHAPSHVCLFEPAERLLLTGDHLLERVALHFDFGFSADPVGEYLTSLDAVGALGANLALPGHGAAFEDIAGAIESTRAEVLKRLDDVEAMTRDWSSAFDVAWRRYGARLLVQDGPLHLAETLALLTHLERRKRVERDRHSGIERWRARSHN
jgi:glyoxylase-like metal-dependent hydrolase (beta-lactamase superfamily II)